jgi:hypothetical protein
MFRILVEIKWLNPRLKQPGPLRPVRWLYQLTMELIGYCIILQFARMCCLSALQKRLNDEYD